MIFFKAKLNKTLYEIQRKLPMFENIKCRYEDKSVPRSETVGTADDQGVQKDK